MLTETPLIWYLKSTQSRKNVKKCCISISIFIAYFYAGMPALVWLANDNDNSQHLCLLFMSILPSRGLDKVYRENKIKYLSTKLKIF